MNKFKLGRFVLLAILVVSCKNNEADALREYVHSNYTITTNANKLSSGSKAQYIQLEKSINQAYVKDLDSLVNTAFERQLERFEDKELGVWAGYCNMFSWLFKSKRSWEEELTLKSSKYFNSLDIEQEQNRLYLQYIDKIRNLRRQFISQQELPQYIQFNLPNERISLDAFSTHSRNNIGIEIIGELLGTKLFVWFLGFVITWIIVTLLGFPTGPPGWLISLISFIIIIIISAIMSISNDSKLMDELREQHEQNIELDSNMLLTELDKNTITFYEKM